MHDLMNGINLILEVFLRFGLGVILVWSCYKIQSRKPMTNIEKFGLLAYAFVLITKLIDLIYATK
jgi:hypothetical protein